MFSWFDSAGVEELPPLFAGEVVEKLELTGEAAAPAAGAVIVAAIAPIGRLDGVEGVDRLCASVHAAVARLAASGVQPLLDLPRAGRPGRGDDPAQIATERQAEQWIRHPDAAAAFMAEAGAGAYPPLFVGPPGAGPIEVAPGTLRCTSVSASA